MRPSDGRDLRPSDGRDLRRSDGRHATTPPQLALTTSQVARRLGVSVGTVRRWSDEGHLRAYRTPGRQRRFSAEEVQAFVSRLER